MGKIAIKILLGSYKDLTRNTLRSYTDFVQDFVRLYFNKDTGKIL